MSRYFNNWRLKINTGKTVCTSFHLANRLAKYQLQITCEGQNIPHEDNPKSLGVTLDRTLTFKMYISKLTQKNSARNNLLRRLAGLSWGANFKVLQTAAVCLVYAPAEYCAPEWSGSTHTAKNRHCAKHYNAHCLRLPEIDTNILPTSSLRHHPTRHS